ncbi:MAG TPA: hypothetical protein VK442_01770 [Xanthobacteraceae bacterium]|nr:hypothetical protein [Xanthobacteraceae bacterium]
MSVIPVAEPPGAATSVVKPSFWRRLAQALDEYFVDRTKRVVPEITLRRRERHIDRLRRLMQESATLPVDASVSRVSRRRVAQATPRR